MNWDRILKIHKQRDVRQWKGKWSGGSPTRDIWIKKRYPYDEYTLARLWFQVLLFLRKLTLSLRSEGGSSHKKTCLALYISNEINTIEMIMLKHYTDAGAIVTTITVTSPKIPSTNHIFQNRRWPDYWIHISYRNSYPVSTSIPSNSIYSFYR